MDENDRERLESLGPAERIIDTLLTYSDHLVHNRPGVVVRDQSDAAGVRWSPVTVKDEAGQPVVYRLDKTRSGKTNRVRVGVRDEAGNVRNGAHLYGVYRPAGLFPEVAAWMYRRVADVWALDNDFAARWASWAFAEEHRDLKVVLAAFMLVQSRAGEAVREDGEVLFHDEDLRAVGEAMCLLRRTDGRDISPKLLLRVGDLLALPEVAEINRALGFGRSAKNPALGRYPRTVEKWLRHRERNPRILQGLVRAGYRRTVMRLARSVGYKPESAKFFEVLRWKQKQAADGRRELAIGAEVAAAESWAELSEAEICQRIIDQAPNYKRIVGLLPESVGLTRAVMAAAIEAGSLSDADLVILTPTLEDLGLLAVAAVRDRWLKASEAAQDERAAHIARRVKQADTAVALEAAAERVVKKAVSEELRGLRVYCAVDISASMNEAIEQAKRYLTQLLLGFPLEKLTTCVFNTAAREVNIRHPSKKGVEHAFSMFRACGGTSYGSAVREVFQLHPPAPDEDALFMFVGDQQESGQFVEAVVTSQLNPVAFALLYVPGSMGDRLQIVDDTALGLQIPCFRIDERTFDDPYALTRTLRRLIASTPVAKGKQRRTGLVEVILRTERLQRPVWA